MEKENKQEVQPERLRRVTGYLVGDSKNFNNGKKAELRDRTKHTGRVGYQQDKGIA